MMMGLVIIGAAIITGRMIRMFKSAAGTMRGIGVGIAVGIAAAVFAEKAMDNDRRLRRNANRAKRAVTGMMDEVGHLVGIGM